ncbi:hypothetical protein ABH907_004919 [Pseudomonas frederiksbergensis]|uniref:GIY-YIG nuclease family protein n=1 Tax=Pseudomonas TaxID=286 RepID=UPI001E333A54|nr:GIY-YIG nuclease family protein [Pseudomonas sp. Bi123]
MYVRGATTLLNIALGTVTNAAGAGAGKVIGIVGKGPSDGITKGTDGLEIDPKHPDWAKEFGETPSKGWVEAGGAKDVVPNPGKTAVYSSTAEDGTVQYVGITDNLEARSAAHLSQKGIEIDAIPGLQNISRSDARAVEQVLIEYNGLGKDGGSLINKINSISTANPIYGESLARGAALLKAVGYPGFK